MVPVGVREQRRLANEALVLGAIQGAAKDGEPCPRDMGIAEATALTRDQVKRAVRSLVKGGIIRVEGRGGTRRITVLATGAATGWTHPTPVLDADVPAPVRMKTRGDRLMEIIIQKAEAGEEMPRGQELADMIGSSADTATRDLRSLERLGVIEIQKFGTKRQITVVATGFQTAILSPGAGRKKRLVRHVRPDELVEPEVDAGDVSLTPCARVWCVDAVALGGAYCAVHEVAEVLEWPMVWSAEEDLAA